TRWWSTPTWRCIGRPASTGGRSRIGAERTGRPGCCCRRAFHEAALMLALELFRSVPRYVAARAVGDRIPGLLAGPLAPLRLVTRDEPLPPADGWARVRPRLAGICGSDLATISGQASFYFSSLVSMPFVPGHEVVGDLFDSCEDLPAGTRVVLEPVLSCAARGLALCPSCAGGWTSRCDRITVGHVAPGLQTGYCADA